MTTKPTPGGASGEYINTRQLAEWLGISPSKLMQDRYKGKGFPFTRVGRRVLYPVREIEQHLGANLRMPFDAYTASKERKS